MRRLALPIALVLTSAVAPASAQTAISGDIFKIDSKVYRLWAIDTLETHQTCADGWPGGVEAKAALRGFLRDAHIACEALSSDRKGRTIARCTADGSDLGAEMVAAGLAVPVDPDGTGYARQEAVAKAHHLGLHGHDCTAAWDWLARDRKAR
ncbi:MAG: thermonuclease family protein [Reyranellaceae bacterium]